jgi:hypothetical protein
MPWCPSCGDEFRPGIEECPDCRAQLTAEPAATSAPTASRPAPKSTTAALSPDDDPVELARLPANMADLVAGELRASGIPVALVGVSPLAGDGGPALRYAEGAPLLVRRRDLTAARAIIERRDDEPLSDEELAAQAAAAAGGDFGDGAVV